MRERLVMTERRDWVIGIGGEETIFKVYFDFYAILCLHFIQRCSHMHIQMYINKIWAQDLRERTALWVVLLWKQSPEDRPWWTPSAWQDALRGGAFGFSGQPDTGEGSMAET